jgi:hypothetical protein
LAFCAVLIASGLPLFVLLQEYTYRVCPFHNVTQGTTLLGKWKSWEIPPTSSGESAVQMFADGIKCYNGPAR